MTFDIEQVKEFIQNTSDETKIYIGADSSRYNKKGVWFAEYATVVIVHLNGKNGCKIFGRVDTERDYDQKKDKPRMRMMNETIRAAQLYLELEEAIGYRDCEIHLDINSDDKFGSFCALSEATGYIKAMCNVIPMVKPDAWAASIGADRFVEIKNFAA